MHGKLLIVALFGAAVVAALPSGVANDEYEVDPIANDIGYGEDQEVVKKLTCNLPPDAWSKSGVRDTRLRWTNRTVVYQLMSGISTREREIINQGLQEIQSKTCIRFRQRNGNDRNYVQVFNNKNGCYSYVGMIGGAQELSLQSNGCMHAFIVAHEFIHAIGFWHEQQRSDRDNFVRVQMQNVARGAEFNFEKLNSSYVGDFGVAYDFKSVMHYENDAASSNGQDTIVPLRDRNLRLGNQQGLTQSDARKINAMYGC